MWNRSRHSSLQHPHAQDFLGQPHGPLTVQQWPSGKSVILISALSHPLNPVRFPANTHSGSVCFPISSILPLVTYSILLAFFSSVLGI